MVRVLEDTRQMLTDRIFLSKAARIALPVALQGMLNTVVNLIDVYKRQIRKRVVFPAPDGAISP